MADESATQNTPVTDSFATRLDIIKAVTSTVAQMDQVLNEVESLRITFKDDSYFDITNGMLIGTRAARRHLKVGMNILQQVARLRHARQSAMTDRGLAEAAPLPDMGTAPRDIDIDKAVDQVLAFIDPTMDWPDYKGPDRKPTEE